MPQPQVNGALLRAEWRPAPLVEKTLPCHTTGTRAHFNMEHSLGAPAFPSRSQLHSACTSLRWGRSAAPLRFQKESRDERATSGLRTHTWFFTPSQLSCLIRQIILTTKLWFLSYNTYIIFFCCLVLLWWGFFVCLLSPAHWSIWKKELNCLSTCHVTCKKPPTTTKTKTNTYLKNKPTPAIKNSNHWPVKSYCKLPYFL